MKYQAVVFDLYGTLIEDQLRKGRDALLVQMAAVLSLPADDFAAAWEQTGDQRTTGGFDTLEECVAHISQALGARPDAERIEAAVELRVGYHPRASAASGRRGGDADAVEESGAQNRVDQRLWSRGADVVE